MPSPSSQDQAVQLLASLDWTHTGKHLMADGELNSPATVSLRHGLGRDKIVGIGLEMLEGQVPAAATHPRRDRRIARLDIRLERQ